MASQPCDIAPEQLVADASAGEDGTAQREERVVRYPPPPRKCALEGCKGFARDRSPYCYVHACAGTHWLVGCQNPVERVQLAFRRVGWAVRCQSCALRMRCRQDIPILGPCPNECFAADVPFCDAHRCVGGNGRCPMPVAVNRIYARLCSAHSHESNAPPNVTEQRAGPSAGHATVDVRMTTRDVPEQPPKCARPGGCPFLPMSPSLYCRMHTCAEDGCTSMAGRAPRPGVVVQRIRTDRRMKWPWCKTHKRCAEDFCGKLRQLENEFCPLHDHIPI